MKKGDCFLCSGEKCRTLYYLTSIDKEKSTALSIYIDQNTVRAWEYADEYGLDFPNDIVMQPSSAYNTIKQLMLNCVDDMHNVLYDEALKIDFELEAGALYTDGEYIYKMLEFKEDRWHYKLFRIEREEISNNWSGNSALDTAKRGLRPITEKTLIKVQKRFDDFLSDIAQCLEQ